MNRVSLDNILNPRRMLPVLLVGDFRFLRPVRHVSGEVPHLPATSSLASGPCLSLSSRKGSRHLMPDPSVQGASQRTARPLLFPASRCLLLWLGLVPELLCTFDAGFLLFCPRFLERMQNNNPASFSLKRYGYRRVYYLDILCRKARRIFFKNGAGVNPQNNV